MRYLPFFSLVMLLTAQSPAVAAPFGVPSTDSYLWDNGEAKDFTLSWDGTLGTFEVEDIGTAYYGSLQDCCTDTFDRVRYVYPGAMLTFTDLSINTMPVNTVFEDNLDLTLLSQGALDNLFLLTGQVTLHWDDPFARMPVLHFAAVPENYMDPQGETSPVPEPASLFLVGSALFSGSIWARRRQRSTPPA